MTNPKNCSTCNSPFDCGDTELGTCWCNQYPALFQPDINKDCFCPDCLHKVTSEKIDHYVNKLSPTEAILINKAKLLPKSSTLIPGIDYYMENGFWIFTAWHHLRRGTCCKSGCRHCPYGFVKQ
jgi:hypothetical protein